MTDELTTGGAGRRFLELRNIHKRFGGVHALRGIDLALDLGEAYHLLGENGCGKSTVIKIMSGAHPPSEGEIVLDGKILTSLSPIQSLAAGIETVYQDLSLIPNLTVAENVALNEQLVSACGRLARLFDRTRLRETAEKALATVGLPTDRAFLNTIVSDLPLAARQLVAIARAIATRAKLVIMDEPTTSLTRREVDNLIRVVERLRSENVAVLFVTHKLDECYRIGGQAIVFRDGQCVAQGPIATYSKKQLAELMTGRSIDAQRYRTANPVEDELFKLDRLAAPGLHGVSLTLRRGEILGITGLADSGRNQLAMAITGVQPATSGTMTLAGKQLTVRRPADAIAQGIGYVPEDRLAEGLFLNKSILENEIALVVAKLSNAFGIVDKHEGRRLAAKLSDDMRLNTRDLDLPVGALSGGNQQRVLIGRWLSIAPKLLVLHGPTVGVDVGSKDTIYRAIQQLAEAGMGLIIVSDDLPELLQNADRIQVMNGGRIVATFDAASASEDDLYRAMLASNPETVQ
ncbi:simple sugar transport system ATP-binding protein [Rhizobium sp. BK529]|uniref:sugar ABC transporter ATP-binding protein n=1 Tax=unclassified Rhizobium TaxID=2613769 RepID=UPI0010462878|nr:MULTISPECIES: sugar ABC transporter ATP-binding protein [unclassified Rhizobium]MBB3593902.1 simple sugar transport system ATP-binding protein [Rhizobium sp. BK529]TCS01359.1 monosaccharide ABC transporter ATP-binding protein (CUT2 family) [Rhizobium sp. BK418]